ncbi:MAG: histidine kinase [Bacteroidota bacterium]
MKSPLFIFLLLISLSSFAQEPVFRHYTVDDGLPGSEVYQTIQDQKGYIWFATDRGICRFDGKNYKTYTTANGLTENTVLGFQKDRSRIWLLYHSGCLGYLEKGNIFNLPAASGIRHRIHHNSLLVTGDTLWYNFHTDPTIYYTTFTHPDRARTMEPRYPDGVFLMTDGKSSYAGSDSIVFPGKCLHPNFSDLKLYYNRNMISRHILRNNNIKIIQTDREGFLVNAFNSIVFVTPKGIIFQKKFNSYIIHLSQLADGSIWLSTFKGGVYRFSSISDLADYSPEKDRTDQFSRHHFLGGKSVSSVFRDTEGGTWFSTLEDGVYYTRSLQSRCYTTSDGLTENKVTDIAVQKPGEIIALLEDGNIFKITSKAVTHLNPGANTDKVSGTIIKRRFGELWYSTHYGIHHFDKRNKFTTLLFPNFNRFNSYFEVSKDSIWLGNISSLFLIRDNKVAFDAFEKCGMKLRCEAICSYGGKLWIGSISGLYTFDSTYHFQGDKIPAYKARIICLKRNRSDMWIATRGSGVMIKHGDKLFSIVEKNGLASDLCNSLYLEGDSIAWVATNRGVSKITYSINAASRFNYRVKNYSNQNGLISHEVNEITRDGELLWLATNKGISVVDLSVPDFGTETPLIYITSVRINNRPFKDPARKIQYQHALRIRFSGISYGDQQRLRYKYRLKGLDNIWKFSEHPEVQYNFLPAGEYTFEVYASIGQQFQSKIPATFSFTVVPAWYRSWWFISTLIAAILLTTYLVYRSKLRRQNKKANQQLALSKRMAALELKALHAQMNPHFIFNALNSIQKFIIRNDPESAHRYLSKFGSLIRSILSNSGNPFLSLHEEVQTLSLYLQLENLRLENNLEYTIQVDPAIDTGNTLIPAMIIQPYVENAVWHGIMPLEKKGAVVITFRLEGKVMYCSIQDNGIGRRKSEELKQSGNLEHKSAGMKITSERLNMLSLTEDLDSSITITDFEEPETGTLVELVLPVKFEFDEPD